MQTGQTHLRHFTANRYGSGFLATYFLTIPPDCSGCKVYRWPKAAVTTITAAACMEWEDQIIPGRLPLATPTKHITASRVLRAQTEIRHQRNEIYRQVLAEILQTLSIVSQRNPLCRTFELSVPRDVPALPTYDHPQCVRYCMEALRRRGFKTVRSHTPDCIIVQLPSNTQNHKEPKSPKHKA